MSTHSHENRQERISDDAEDAVACHEGTLNDSAWAHAMPRFDVTFHHTEYNRGKKIWYIGRFDEHCGYEVYGVTFGRIGRGCWAMLLSCSYLNDASSECT